MTISKELTFVCSSEEYSGVKKIAHKVAEDVQKVFGFEPTFMECEALTESKLLEITSPVLIFGTFSKSVLIAQAEEQTVIQTREIFDKYESYNFTVKNNIIYICGSDKRGTIYGLFHLSQLIGVSPLVDWNNIQPTKKDSFELEEIEYLSKQPSVRYRGFFINDEWPSFGNWANHNFGGVNANCYEHIFELLLRLKGNYLWPAMWASRFSDDGPDLQSAELADELGVIMGASHHEPCCRAGEEYKHLRGKDSVYGDAWNFRTNKKGITKFWEDGLKRNGKFENVITVGMRGEADTAIMQNASLKDNIDLLRDVIKTQNQLIKENVNDELAKVPRMLALYKEVEPYFYGNKFTKGLMNDPCLDGVTLMLCDDNHGNLRTVPTKQMRNHKGGYGMYYHFDYHGWPYSYEWINTTYLPKVKEQMCAAYNFGIRELWIVNVGDILTNEFPLSYFLDLAYDFEKYSTAENTTQKYTKEWIDFNFAFLSTEQKEVAYSIIDGYTKITNMRRTECLKPDTFSSFNFSEAQKILDKAEQIIKDAEELKKQTKKSPNFESVYAQIIYPALGTMNIVRMNIFSGFNQSYAKANLLLANSYVKKIKDCLAYDKQLIQESDTVADTKYYAMAWSEHFGFNYWCEAMNSYPVYCTVEPTRKKRFGIWVEGTELITSGQDWAIRDLYTDSLTNPNINQFTVNLASCSLESPEFEITFNKPEQLNWLSYKIEEQKDDLLYKINVTVNRDKLSVDSDKTAIMCIKSREDSSFMVNVHINAKVPALNYPNGTYIQTGSYISIEAPNFTKKQDTVYTTFSSPLLNGLRFNKKLSIFQNIQEDVVCHFEILPGYGKTFGAVKAFPENQTFNKCQNLPYVEYSFVVQKNDIYAFDFYTNPSNPAFKNNKLQIYTQINGQKLVTNLVEPKTFKVGDNQEVWGQDITNNIRKTTVFQFCKKGLNTLRFSPLSANIVLEKIVIYSTSTTIPTSYLGAPETYRVIKGD